MRILIFIALLCVAAQGRGQIYINSYTFGAAVSDDLLLDSISDARIALSLRKLDKDYTGNCITVRRASNGDTTNIGFIGNYLDTATLKTFCASTNCFVRTWFDQSGNNYNARMTTDGNQPKIHDSSTGLTKINGKVSIDFDGTNDNLQALSTLLPTYISLYLVNKATTAKPFFIEHSADAGNNNGFYFFGSNGATWLMRRTTTHSREGNTNWAGSDQGLFAFIYTSNEQSQYKNNTLQTNLSTSGTLHTNSNITTTLNIMARNNTSVFSQSNLQEFLIFDQQDDKRTQISNNINNFYTIY